MIKLTPPSLMIGISLFVFAELAPFCYWSQIQLIAWAIKDYASYMAFWIIYPLVLGTACICITLAIDKFQSRD